MIEIIKAEDLRKMMEDKFNDEEIQKLSLEYMAERTMSNIKFVAERAKYSYMFDMEKQVKYLDLNSSDINNGLDKILSHLQFIMNSYNAGEKDKYLNFVSKLQQLFIDAGYTISQEEGIAHKYQFTISWNKKKDEN